MTHNFTISLKNRIALTYALFISLALAILCFIINIFAGKFFTDFVKDNITAKSKEIVRMVAEQYDPWNDRFNTATIEAMGMYFAGEGYIVTVEDGNGSAIWDARSCNMRHCMDVIQDITIRMENRFNMPAVMRIDNYPVVFGNRNAGTVMIETYGPYFYSETEARFLSTINLLLLITGIVLTGISIIISAALSRAIAKPILIAASAAQKIAQTYSASSELASPKERPVIRIPDQYNTRELAELSHSINTLAEELEEGERRQKQLVSDVAHELRTPLTCLQGNIEAMIDGVYNPDKERLESCQEEIIRLANLVQDLNTLTTLEWETITLNKTEFDLAKLLQITAEQWRQSAREKGVEINLNTQETIINADYDRLKQVFINLLSNAVKYTDRGSITIAIEKTNESSAGQCVVSIADTGIGIPQDDLPHIFERFYRSDKSRSRSTGGAGIGLTIATAIVRAHGGFIEAKSGEMGTVFNIAL
ncbi:MAG: HAMP domain-containing histidine kinase [Treponema sp.]|jgi:signal transduction histidine kinase|nr:HAMP domain-containing histidine kinase [Treponema sp.]